MWRVSPGQGFSVGRSRQEPSPSLLEQCKRTLITEACSLVCGTGIKLRAHLLFHTLIVVLTPGANNIQVANIFALIWACSVSKWGEARAINGTLPSPSLSAYRKNAQFEPPPASRHHFHMLCFHGAALAWGQKQNPAGGAVTDLGKVSVSRVTSQRADVCKIQWNK